MARAPTEKAGFTTPRIVGERREVTVLVLDTVHTGAADALDSEEVFLFTDEALQLLASVIDEYEGTVDSYTEDGLLALFGAPVAHENDPERAVRAALQMQANFEPLRQRMKEKRGTELQMRIGIHTGVVVVGKVGAGQHTEYTIVGDTLNTAYHLRDAAEIGTVAVSFSTYQRTRPFFRYLTLPPTELKQTPRPVRAFCPLSLRPRPGQVRGLAGLQVPMIGRQDGLEQLRQTVARVYQLGESHVALITGEAGVGKSRLVAEFLATLVQPDLGVYQGNCLTYAQSKPLWLLASVLRSLMNVTETDPPEMQYKTLQAYLEQLGLDRDTILPYLAYMLGLEQKDSGHRIWLRHLDSMSIQKLIHAALREVLQTEARLSPMILVLEDLHWIDPASREFLGHLIQTTGSVPMMLILISRDSERDAVIRPLVAAAEARPDRLVDIQLTPLSDAEGQLLVQMLLRQADDATQELNARIAERAEGNPFYAEEIVRMLIEQGGLEPKTEGYQVTPQAKDILQEVPGTLTGLIQARLDRLPEPLRRTLRWSAVLGSVFPIRLLQKLSGVDASEVIEQVGTLEARHFLRTEPSDSGLICTFRHNLIQEVVYNTILRHSRQQLHEQAAQALEQGRFWLPDEQNEALAYHYGHSGNPSKAVPYLMTAAENAARRCANQTAIQHYRQALTLMREQASRPSDEFLRAQLGLGQVLKFVGEYPEASQVLKDALRSLLRPEVMTESKAVLPLWVQGLRELADIHIREGSPGEAIAELKAGLDLLGNEGSQAYPTVWRLLVDRLAWVRFRQGELDEAFALATEAALGLDPESAEDPMTLASLHNLMGGVAWQQGNLADAIAYVERSLGLYESLGYTWGMANAYNNLGILHYRRGNWSGALDNWQRARELRQAIGDVQNHAATLINIGLLHMSMGKHEAAGEDLQRALADGRHLGDDWLVAHSLVVLAHLALVQDRTGVAEEHAQTALGLSEVLGGSEIQVQANWILGLAQANCGHLETGLGSAQRALALARESGLVDLEADCLRVLGVLRARIGEWMEAETLFQESIEMCRQQDDPYRQGQALLELGRMYRQLADAGDLTGADWRIKALESLGHAASRFERLGAAHDLKVTREELMQIQEETTEEVLPALPEGEWRQAALIWLTLKLPPDADEEVAFETMTEVTSALVAIAQEYQGQIIRRHDGLTVVFGAPVAFEDDAERAVQAASRMVRYVSAAARRVQASPTCVAAVSHGSVVAGRIGPRFNKKFVVKGQPVEDARCIAESASDGQVWVTEAICVQTERLFRYERAGDPVAGIVEPAVSRLVGIHESPEPARGLPGVKTRLIGRDAPLRAMLELAGKLKQRMGGMIWIEGEPGIGKSRLMRELIVSMTAGDHFVWKGRCSPQRSTSAFSLFHDLFAQAFGLKPSDAPEQIHAKIERSIHNWPRDAQSTRPYLETLLGIQPIGSDGARLAALQPEQLRQQVFVALRRCLKSLAAEQPLVLLLDDMHWIDPVSAELLTFLLPMVTTVPILFVGAQRRQGADQPNDRLVRLQSLIPTQTVRLCLERLSIVESEMLLTELLPEIELSSWVQSTVLERSEGNPYFIEEYVRMLIEQGHLQQGAEGWVLVPAQQPKELPLPSSLEALLRSRIDALPSELRQLVQYAAIVGATFEADLLESLPELSNVRALLARLESRLLVRRGTEADEWHFNHSLIEAVTYESMLKAQRKILHLRVAQALEARWTGVEAEHAEELAYHYSRADVDAKALHYLVLAGERAATRYANEEALGFFEQAIQRLDQEPEAATDLRWRISAGLGDVHRAMGQYADSKAALNMGLALVEAQGLGKNLRAGLLRRLGETDLKQRDLDGAQQHFTEALELVELASDERTEAEAARMLTGLAWSYLYQGQIDNALEACEAGVEHAQRTGALNELAAAENLMGGIYYSRSEWTPALQHTTRAMVLREQMGYTWGAASTLANLGILAVSAGQWSKARAFFERSLAMREEHGDVEGVVIAHHNLGMLTRDQGELDLAEFHFRASLEIGTPLEMTSHMANSLMGLAECYLMQGELEQAEVFLAQSLTRAEAIGIPDLLTEIYRIQAEIALAKSALDEAQPLVARSTSLATESRNRSLEATAWRVASQIELQKRDFDAAHQSLARARQALADVTDELEAGRVAAQAAQIHLCQGQPAEAETELRAAKDIFERLGAWRDLLQIEGILRKLPAIKT